jgi:hypothetical protein
MKPTKDNLKEELKYRLSCIEDVMKENDEEPLSLFLKYEHSVFAEVLQLMETFENRLGYQKFKVLRYTPLFCSKTNEPLLIGDLVEDNNKRCGTLQFDDYTKRYVIKGVEGGNIHTTIFIKIPELYEFKIDAGRTECRTPDKYLKRRW